MKLLKQLLFAGGVVVLLVSMLSVEALAANGRRARYTAQQRAQIRAMPILERPSRPFHFYGNTVRRNAAKVAKTRQSGQSSKEQKAPVMAGTALGRKSAPVVATTKSTGPAKVTATKQSTRR